MLTSKIAFKELFEGYKKLIVTYICVLLSVFVMMTVGQLADNLQQKLLLDAKLIFGGDITVTSANFPLNHIDKKYLEGLGKISYTTEFRSMASYKGDFKLVELKGVDSDYPLLGKLLTKLNSNLPIAKGDVIIAPELQVAFGLDVGDTINLSGHNFKVVDILISEPDWLVTSFKIGPRVIVGADSLAELGLLEPGNLVQYNYSLLLNNSADLEKIENDIAQRIPQALVKNFKTGTSVIKNSISRLEFFLMLAAISNLIICGLGIAVSSKRYLESKSQNIAILKSIGCSKFEVIKIYSQILFIVTLDASLFAAIASSVLCYFLVPYLNTFIDLNISYGISWRAIFSGFVFAFISTFCFALPALYSSASIKPASLFRRFSPLLIVTNWQSILLYISSTVILILLILQKSYDKSFAIKFIAVAIIFVLGFFYATKIVQRIVARFDTNIPWLKLAKTNIQKQQSALPTMILSVSIALSILIALNTVELNFRDLLNENIPKRAPSLFLLDISKDEVVPLFDLFARTEGVSEIQFKPTIQGLITHINDVPIEKVKIDESAKWVVSNHRRLSYSNPKPENADIVEGEWWDEGYFGDPLISIDERIFNGMHLKVGDEISFNIIGEVIKARIGNVRRIDYSSFNINFAIIFSPNVIEKFPLSYFATVRTSDKNIEFKLLKEVSKEFPTVVSVRTEEGIAIASKQINNIIAAINIIVLFSIASGFVVLVGTFLGTEESRKYDTVVFKILGASRKYIFKAYLFEWMLSGVISCIFSIICGSLGGYLILRYLYQINFAIPYASIIYTSLGTIALILITVVLTNYRILRVKPMDILKNE